jgi:hypothetical protein
LLLLLLLLSQSLVSASRIISTASSAWQHSSVCAQFSMYTKRSIDGINTRNFQLMGQTLGMYLFSCMVLILMVFLILVLAGYLPVSRK